jgi:hypothetical protein
MAWHQMDWLFKIEFSNIFACCGNRNMYFFLQFRHGDCIYSRFVGAIFFKHYDRTSQYVVILTKENLSAYEALNNEAFNVIFTFQNSQKQKHILVKLLSTNMSGSHSSHLNTLNQRCSF